MIVSQQVLQSFKDHYADVYEALQTNNGLTFQNVNIPRMNDYESMERILWMDFWDTAIQKDAHVAYHDMAMRTPAHALIDVWNMCVEMHGIRAVIGLAPRMKRDVLYDTVLLPNIHCMEENEKCVACEEMRYEVFRRLDQVDMDSSGKQFLDDDYLSVRKLIATTKTQNLTIMRHPIFWFHYKTDIIYRNIIQKTRYNWNILFFATCVIKMWRRFIERQYHPDSNYIRKVKEKFNKLKLKN